MKHILISCVLSLGALACGKAESSPAPSPAAPAKAVSPLVQAYDVVREALASDDLAAAQAKAKDLEKAADKHAPLAAAASKVSAMADIEDARKAFGDVSKALLEVIKAEPAVGEGLIAYRCPMAQGYPKWVQTGPPMRNPYMGKKMLECGSKAELTP